MRLYDVRKQGIIHSSTLVFCSRDWKPLLVQRNDPMCIRSQSISAWQTDWHMDRVKLRACARYWVGWQNKTMGCIYTSCLLDEQNYWIAHMSELAIHEYTLTSSCMFTFAPASSSRVATAVWPFRAASWSGLSPSCVQCKPTEYIDQGVYQILSTRIDRMFYDVT